MEAVSFQFIPHNISCLQSSGICEVCTSVFLVREKSCVELPCIEVKSVNLFFEVESPLKCYDGTSSLQILSLG